MSQIKIECVDKLGVFITKKKRIKIIVGGRASTKSTFVADYVLSKINSGQRWCCSREYLNSIDDSVHALLEEEIERNGYMGFTVGRSGISHVTGGEAFYKGLARNIASIKSVITDGLWIEEGETLSKHTLKILTASIRVSAGKYDKARQIAEEEGISVDDAIEFPEIWITMNRGSRKDPISERFLKIAEPSLAKTGYHEDENMMVMEINYPDIPRSWFLASGLESERDSDEKHMSRAEYRHKWHGHYSDTIENAIIKPEWFDACIDAHKKLGFKPSGQEKVAFDPSDVGDDPEAIAYSHGSVVLQAMQRDQKDIEAACDWATDFANEVQADVFAWDCDGMGIGLKRQVRNAFNGKKVTTDQFKGSEGPMFPDSIYEALEQEQAKPKKNKDAFRNQRAQFYFGLMRRVYNTFLAVKNGKYINPDEMISFSSDIIHLDLLRAEICSIPRKYTGGTGRFQVMSKIEMAKMEIASPNIADCIMMLQKPVDTFTETEEIPYYGWGS